MSLPSRLIVECPLCHTSYPENAVRVIGETGAGKLYHCSCGACGRSMLALMRENTGYVSTVGLVTDQKAEDAIRLSEQPVISSDDCIAAHILLDEESRDFVESLAESGK
jgi:hypothetical protein